MAKTIYLTGGTGFLGSHFVRNHLSTWKYRVQCFVRGSSNHACTQRIKQAVLAVNTSYPAKRTLNLDGITGIPSDITLPRLGLSEEWLHAARQESQGAAFFHFASSLNSDERNREMIYDHNIKGLGNAVDVAAALGCTAFYYISTAYTVGIHQGQVAEELHYPGAFNNYYEETKCAAEHLITELCAANGMGVVIVRPSVVIGPSVSCQTGGSTTGLYGLIREMHRVKRHLRQTQVPVSAYFNLDAAVNFIPVDYVCQDIFRLFDDPLVRGGLHHATAENNVSIAALVGLIAHHLDLPEVTLQQLDRFDVQRASSLEKLLARTMAYYNSMTRTTKNFERHDGAHWTLDMDEVERYVIEGIRALDPVASQPVELLRPSRQLQLD